MFSPIRKMLREPMLHFFATAAGLFLLFHIVSDQGTASGDRIVVSAGQIAHIRSLFLASRQRLPDEDELRNLIDEYIVEEVFYREAIAIGFDKDDTIIRRRLRQKMEFLLDDFTAAVPTDTDLQRYLDVNPERFRSETRISFEQVLLNAASGSDVETIKMNLRAGNFSEVTGIDQSNLIPRHFEDVKKSKVTIRLGKDFSAALFELGIGQWTGPVNSPFGAHLIRVDGVSIGRVPSLDEIREEVGQEWLFDFRESYQQQVLNEMKAKYTITVEHYESGGP